jgi:hypothetical protein
MWEEGNPSREWRQFVGLSISYNMLHHLYFMQTPSVPYEIFLVMVKEVAKNLYYTPSS